jgi:hypothetical protein
VVVVEERPVVVVELGTVTTGEVHPAGGTPLPC